MILNHSHTVESVEGFFCSDCENYSLEPAEAERFSTEQLAFKSKLRGESIKQIRKDLAVSITDAGRIFGGGINAFREYESGQKRPPLALLQLMRLMRDHPELLPEVKAVAALKDERFFLAA